MTQVISSLICTSLSCSMFLCGFSGNVTLDIICRVTYFEGIGVSQSMVYICPFSPGPTKPPQIWLVFIFSAPEIFLSSINPARISRLASRHPKESIRFTIVTLEITLSLPNVICIHGYSSSLEWKNPKKSVSNYYYHSKIYSRSIQCFVILRKYNKPILLPLLFPEIFPSMARWGPCSSKEP